MNICSPFWWCTLVLQWLLSRLESVEATHGGAAARAAALVVGRFSRSTEAFVFVRASECRTEQTSVGPTPVYYFYVAYINGVLLGYTTTAPSFNYLFCGICRRKLRQV